MNDSAPVVERDRATDEHSIARTRFAFVLPNAIAVSALSATAKLAGAIKTVIMARVFGASPELDLYLLTFLIPSFVSEVLCGPIVPLLVPQLVAFAHRDDNFGASQIYGSVLRRSLLGQAAIAILLGLCCLFVPSGSSRVLGVLALLPWMLPILPLSAASNVWRAVLNANNHFRIAAGTVVLTPAITVMTLLIGKAYVYRLALATTLGATAEAVVLGIAVAHLGWPIFGSPKAKGVREKFSKGQYTYLATSAMITNGALLLNQSMAATLEAGAVAILNFGTRLTGVLSAIGPEALGVSLLPVFSKMMVTRDRAHFAHSVRRVVLFAMVVATVVTGVFVLFSTPIIRVIFQHGAFQSDDTQMVATVQRLSLLQFPFTLGITLLSRAIASASANRVMVPIAATGVAINVVLNIVWMRSYSVAGVAAATTVAQICTFTILAFVASRILRPKPEPSC